jgi:hypothetical protein
MEGPGIISNIMDKSTTEGHPGTINFPYRLAKAKQIHQENLAMASRLDSVKAYYDSKTLAAMTKQQRNGAGHLSPKKLKLTKRDKATEESRTGTSVSRGGGGSVFDQHGRIVLGRNALHIHHTSGVDSAGAGGSSASNYDQSTSGPKRPRNVLLEYTKIQRGRVLDVAVIKEPFRDNYCIFGIDIDNGQRYELKLSSEEVSNILEGDILVTSVDNVEVWMTLLTKIELSPVEAFAKIPLPAAPHFNHHAPPAHRTNQHPDTTPSLGHDYDQDGEHDTPAESSSVYLEDETLNSALACQKSSTPIAATSPASSSSNIISTTSIEPQTESPKSFLKNYQRNSSDSLETTTDTATKRGEGGGNDSASILTAGDPDDHRYTLDEYYDSNIELTPLPLSESSTTVIKQANSEAYGDVVADPYYGQLDNATMLQNRPSARSTSRDQQGASRPITATTQTLTTLTMTAERDDIKESRMTEMVSQLAVSTIAMVMTSVLKELQQVVEEKKKTEQIKSQGRRVSTKDNPSSNTERKKSVTISTTAERKKSSVSAVNKTNPYRSTKVSTSGAGAGGRSHSIRYTNEEASNVVTATAPAPVATTTTATATTATPLQPTPPTEIQSSKQQSGIRKQSAVSASLSTRRQSAAASQAAVSVAPIKPQESMPSSRRPSKQSSVPSSTSPRKMSKMTGPQPPAASSQSQPVPKEVRVISVEDCHQLALSTAASVIELAQQNIQKLIQLTEK